MTRPVAATGGGTTTVVVDPARMRGEIQHARAGGKRIGFVPTMGALHAGHASLVAAAAAGCDDVVVSIFVNPTQFAPHEDFTRYPRPLAADVAMLDRLGVRWAFAPTVEAMYPHGPERTVAVGSVAERFEGALRPGHFSGVATVVKRLFEIVPADVAYFGAKDWQQTVVVRQMVREHGIPIEVAVLPTVRDPDGLALSSRNAYLSPAHRTQAVALAEGLAAAADRWSAGDSIAVAEEALRSRLARRDVTCDYAAIVDPESLEPLADPRGPAIALVAGRLGTTRLLDNRLLPVRAIISH